VTSQNAIGCISVESLMDGAISNVERAMADTQVALAADENGRPLSRAHFPHVARTLRAAWADLNALRFLLERQAERLAEEKSGVDG